MKSPAMSVLLLCLAAIAACQKQEPLPLPPPPEPPPVPVANLEPGPRPRQIDGAPVFTVESYLRALKNNPPVNTNDNQRCAIEGIVKKQGERFGAKYVVLSSEDRTMPFSFEGGILDRCKFTDGQRVILLGRRMSNTMFSDARPASQAEIDGALQKESQTL